MVSAARCPSCFTNTGGGPCADCRDRTRADSALPLQEVLREGRYRIGRTLGEPGGFGVTYLGWDETLERRVAIKEYFPWHAATRAPGTTLAQPASEAMAARYRAGLDSFIDEARRLAAIDHENVLKVLDYLETNGTGYIVMPFYEGEDLAAYHEALGGTVPWREVVEILAEILDGLQQVHDAGLIHRDIKPANIYLARTPTGARRPILIDFGAARWTTTGREMTAILTEGFAPLEQYSGAGQGPPTDLYAVAATAYWLISGRLPHSAPARATGFATQPLHELVRDAPEALSLAIAAGMEMKAVDRPQSARAFAQLLRQAVLAPAADSLAAGKATLVIPRTRESRPVVAPVTPPIPATAVSAPSPAARSVPGRSARPRLLVGAGVLFAFVIAVGVVVARTSGSPIAAPTSPSAAPVSSPSAAATGSHDASAPRAPAVTDGAARAWVDSAGRALADGGYAAAMRHAARAHEAGLGAVADSMAGVISAACMQEATMLKTRGVRAARCPGRPW